MKSFFAVAVVVACVSNSVAFGQSNAGDSDAFVPLNNPHSLRLHSGPSKLTPQERSKLLSDDHKLKISRRARECVADVFKLQQEGKLEDATVDMQYAAHRAIHMFAGDWDHVYRVRFGKRTVKLSEDDAPCDRCVDVYITDTPELRLLRVEMSMEPEPTRSEPSALSAQNQRERRGGERWSLPAGDGQGGAKLSLSAALQAVNKRGMGAWQDAKLVVACYVGWQMGRAPDGSERPPIDAWSIDLRGTGALPTSANVHPDGVNHLRHVVDSSGKWRIASSVPQPDPSPTTTPASPADEAHEIPSVFAARPKRSHGSGNSRVLIMDREQWEDASLFVPLKASVEQWLREMLGADVVVTKSMVSVVRADRAAIREFAGDQDTVWRVDVPDIVVSARTWQNTAAPQERDTRRRSVRLFLTPGSHALLRAEIVPTPDFVIPGEPTALSFEKQRLDGGAETWSVPQAVAPKLRLIDAVSAVDDRGMGRTQDAQTITACYVGWSMGFALDGKPKPAVDAWSIDLRGTKPIPASAPGLPDAINHIRHIVDSTGKWRVATSVPQPDPSPATTPTRSPSVPSQSSPTNHDKPADSPQETSPP